MFGDVNLQRTNSKDSRSNDNPTNAHENNEQPGWIVNGGDAVFIPHQALLQKKEEPRISLI